MFNPAAGPGRHRARRARLSVAQRIGGVAVILGASGFAAIALSTTAVADAPMQTAWWQAVSAGGQAAPDPATPEGGLHVSVASGQVLAYGAVLYSLTEGSTATLEFKVSNITATPVVNPTSPSTTPAADIVACPTKNSWKAGDGQSMDNAPGYDCTRSIPGNLSADQTTLTFLVDSSVEVVPGQLNLAIVPVVTDNIPGAGTPAPVDVTQPFSLDIAKPDATSLTITSSAALPPPPPVPASGGTTAGSTAGSSSQTSTSSGGGSSDVSLPGSLAASGSTTPDTGVSPVVAPSSAPAVPNAAPAAATNPATSDRAHNAALAMLLLIGLGLIAMSSGQMQRAPRLLGGAGRHAAREGGVAAVAPAPVMPVMGYGSRGLGRFAKQRTEPPRPLT
jgi:hypothetical protein